MPERDHYVAERNQATQSFFEALAGLLRVGTQFLEILIEQEKEEYKPVTRPRPGRSNN